MDKILKLSFNTTSEKRETVRSNYELYSHDKNNNQFELHIENETLTTETVKVLFKFMKSKSYWETKGTIEDNKVKFKFDTSLITQNELVNCYILLSKDDKEMDAYSFGFDVKLSEYDVKDKLPTKERYFANSVVVDKLDVLTKEVMLAELDKARSTYALKSELSDVVRLSNISDVVRTNAISDVVRRAELESKGYLTEHQSLIDYALRSELPREYDDNEIKQRLTSLEGRPTLPSINPDDYVTKNELDTRGYLTQHQDISGLATKQELQEVSNRQVTIDTSNLATKEELEQVRNNQPTVDTSNLATKEELNQLRGSQPNVDNLVTKDELNSKGYLTQHQSLEEYAKKTELPQPYNDTDITNRLTALENRPAGNGGDVDVSNFITKQEVARDYAPLSNVVEINKQLTVLSNRRVEGGISSAEIDEIKSSLNKKIDKNEIPFKSTSFTRVEDYLNNTNEHIQYKNFGRLYTDTFGNHLVVSGGRKTVKFETLLYTVGSSLPDAYEPDFEFSEGDNIKFITTRNIHDYLPTNTGNTGNTTALDNRLKVLEAKNWEIHGRGMPNGVVTAPVGTTYVDEAVTNGALKWIKKTGTGNTGWEVLIGDTGWKVLPSVSKLGGSYVKIRRVNNIVSYQFGGLQWGWFGIVRRGGAGYVLQGSDRERNCYIIQNGGIPIGYRAEASLIGNIYNDKGVSYGTWYLGGNGDYNQLRFQFTDPVPTDRDIGDIRISSISYLTNEPWPQN